MNKNKTVIDISKWFLSKESLTPKKIQKLVYYAQAWSYALKDKAIAFDQFSGNDSKFEAWAHGPVNTDLYNKYREFRWSAVDKINDYKSNFNKDEEFLLEDVWTTYGELHADELEELTHSEKPWIKAREATNAKKGDISSEKISVQDMKDFYRSISLENDEYSER